MNVIYCESQSHANIWQKLCQGVLAFECCEISTFPNVLNIALQQKGFPVFKSTKWVWKERQIEMVELLSTMFYFFSIFLILHT